MTDGPVHGYPTGVRQRMLAGDVSGVDPRFDLPHLRLLVEEAAREGADLLPFFSALATRAPLALVDLVAGPRAVPGAAVVRAALQLVADLEAVMAPASLYRRLIHLSPATAVDALTVAAARHPRAPWMIVLSEQVTGAGAVGTLHLVAAADLPEFASLCWSHAAAGHLEGLVEAAAMTGRPEPVAALVGCGAVEPARLAAARALESGVAVPLVAWVAATWGPDVDLFFAPVVSLLREPAAVRKLEEQAGPAWPRTRARLLSLPPSLRTPAT